MFTPRFQVTPTIARALMAIEADRRQVDALPIDVTVLASLRETARLAATHHSTRIEGNRLTLAGVADVLAGARFPGRERDEREVRHYARALAEVERLAARPGPLAQADVQRLHGLVMTGRAGYGLKGIYDLDAYYADDLPRYYDALTVGTSHNYYFGRAEADVTAFVAYFCEGMAQAFAAVRARAGEAAARGVPDRSRVLRMLDPRQRSLLGLFRTQGTASTAEIAAHLGLSTRSVPPLCRAWLAAGFLALHDPSKKRRVFRLGEVYEDALGP